MLSPIARNPVLNADLWDYNSRLGPWRYQFWNVSPSTTDFLNGLGIALLTAIVTSRLGLWIGKGLARVQR